MEDTRMTWHHKFLEALEYDAWGQVEEAAEAYHRLQVAAAAEHEENVLQLPPQRRAAIGHLARVLQLRLEELRGSTGSGGSSGGSSGGRGGGVQGQKASVGLAGMQSLKAFVTGLIVSDVQLPPTLVPLVGGATPSPGVQLAPWPRRTGLGASGAEEADSASVPEGPDGGWTRASSGGAAAASAMLGTDAFGRGPGAERGTLRPPPEDLAPGEATLSVFIDSWRVKGADSMHDASVAISVRDAAGRLVEAVQETPPPDSVSEQQLRWGATVHLQTLLSRLEGAWAVFFELRHWKPAKKKRSVKAWCQLDSDELGPLLQPQQQPQGHALEGSGDGDGHRRALEVYAKPPQYARGTTAPRLLSSKPLYLQVAIHVTRH
ncbi:hypothetical protein MNEG_3752 [Monoraphidium neglectum]|uniref:C2 Aida-type domain-containing protein n=1 Tax=Monoraphidium neglectum TaxID=145388 RepID=A0A0D2MNE2_9CHLO|nr:hypothetical protein MNEG_3752 [Monoraphidium neglectum]KIZ04210.1 hypothetical protein MNEG_3752 [Monoraphidium neglectum]|eukprot:XP_013903229.1 hypothetical protein MNEG_3752 [Monoraphidium neglectum]